MSEYQYYEFRAVDRPLGEGDRKALRALSTRANITATSFSNHYEWGDFKGDPARLMEKWFDLHLYLSNWGTRRLMIRWPERLVDRQALAACLGDVDGVRQRVVGGNLILDILVEEVEGEAWDDGSESLAAMAPLRADVLGGDLRVFYLLWLTAVEGDAVELGDPEPLPGLGPLTGPLEAFVDFFGIDPDLAAAAAERPFRPVADEPDLARSVVAGMEGAARTVADLRVRAEAIRIAREREKIARLEAEAERQAKAAERGRRARLDSIRRRGEAVWTQAEAEIERRNGAAYARAAALLHDLGAIAEQDGSTAHFKARLQKIRTRHAAKTRFIERLQALG
ncbi:MAG: hypothetical protein KIS90_02105 [Phenylobacterium sp.]|nr:hypothetical protein [Phenylobacterium sp.]MCW5758550.1 hypothetical protein [Phenylobacterium sp.]